MDRHPRGSSVPCDSLVIPAAGNWCRSSSDGRSNEICVHTCLTGFRSRVADALTGLKELVQRPRTPVKQPYYLPRSKISPMRWPRTGISLWSTSAGPELRRKDKGSNGDSTLWLRKPKGKLSTYYTTNREPINTQGCHNQPIPEPLNLRCRFDMRTWAS